MHRIAFKMKLLQGCEEEYKKRHNQLWPEMKELLKETGISSYSIFIDPADSSLFAVLHVEDRQDLTDLGTHPLMQKWWNYLADIMETNSDNSPVQLPLQEVFYLR